MAVVTGGWRGGYTLQTNCSLGAPMRFPLFRRVQRVYYSLRLADGTYQDGSFDTVPKSSDELRAQLMRVSAQPGREVREIASFAWSSQPGWMLLAEDIVALFRRRIAQ